MVVVVEVVLVLVVVVVMVKKYTKCFRAKVLYWIIAKKFGGKHEQS